MEEGQAPVTRLESRDDGPWRPGGDASAAVVGSADASVSAPGDVGLVHRSESVDARWSRDHDRGDPGTWQPGVREPVPDAVTRAQQSAPRPRAPIAAVEGQLGDSVTSDLAVGAILVAIALVGALLAISVVRPAATESAEGRALPMIPTGVETLWSAEVDAAVDRVAVGGGVLVAALSGEPDLVAFDLETGAELWRQPADLPDRGADAIDVIGDRVVVERRGPSGVSGVTVLDSATGDRVWSADDGGTYRLRGSPGRRSLIRLSRQADGSALELVDPVDGTVVGEPVSVSAVSVAGDDVVAQRYPRERVGVWSMRDLVPVTGPVAAFNLRTLAALDGAVVALDLDRRIIAFGPDGERLDERLLDTLGEAELGQQLGVVPGGRFAVVASVSSVGFEVRDGRIELVWQRPGRAGLPVDTAGGPLSLLVEPVGDGEAAHTLIDPRTGETLAVAGRAREAEPYLGHNAYVAAPERRAAERRLEAVTYDGEPLWQLPIGDGATYHFADGVVVVVDDVQGTSTIVVAG